MRKRKKAKRGAFCGRNNIVRRKCHDCGAKIENKRRTLCNECLRRYGFNESGICSKVFPGRTFRDSLSGFSS